MASSIDGEWTHRRGDPGGTRSVSAHVERPRPKIAWAWRPEHGGQVDQVRVAGQHVLVATMTPADPRAPGWEHAVVYALDAKTGAEVARRYLPDPVPVAAMVVEAGVLHVVATRRGEPIFWYALSPSELVPKHRRIVSLSTGHDDVLEAWAAPDGGLWLELEAAIGGDEARNALAYAFADLNEAETRVWRPGDAGEEDPPVARDACAGGLDLFAPIDGLWSADPVPPSLARLRPGAREDAWARATVVGPRAQIHAMGNDRVVCGVVLAQDPERADRARVEAFAVDRASGSVDWRAVGEKVEVKPRLGEGARAARRPNGEILFQSLAADGTPCTPLLCARPDGRVDVIALGTGGRYVLDAALGDTVLAHRQTKNGRVEVGGFAIDHEGRLLGRRAALRWTIDAGDLGAGTTVYAGAGAVVVRGTRAVSAVTL